MKMKTIVILIVLVIANNCTAQKGSLIPGIITSKLERDFKGARIANKSDFGAYFNSLKDIIDIASLYNTIIIHDITRDSKDDYVLLLINTQERYFSFVAYVSDNNYSKPYILSTSTWPQNHDGTIWQVMWLKPVGEEGLYPGI